MRATRAIAANTFREAIRDRILYLFVGFAVVMVLSSKLFGMLTVGDEGKIVKDIGLASMQFFSMLIAVMMSMILVSREIDNRTVFNILAKPVRRWQFLLGKYLGLAMIIGANLVLITFVLIITVFIVTGELDLMLAFAGIMTMLEMLVLAAFATLFAVLTRPILGSLMTLAVYVVGHLERFNFRTEVVHDLEIPVAAVGWTVVYAMAFVALVLVLANLRFRTRDLK
jgi:ABC-type transport system involved in multi-copper enzyme maturation permease subunit